MSKIYYHLFTSHVSLNTPKIEFKNKQLIKINYGLIEEKIQKIKDAYKSRIAPYKDLDKMDYRDIFLNFFLLEINFQHFF